jgi:hypothetical protein
LGKAKGYLRVNGRRSVTGKQIIESFHLAFLGNVAKVLFKELATNHKTCICSIYFHPHDAVRALFMVAVMYQ